MTAFSAHFKKIWPRHFSPSMLILTPLKQHIGCCVVLPLLLKLMGGIAVIQLLTKNNYAELVILGIALPFLTYIILKGEEAWMRRHSKRHAAKHDPCDHACASHTIQKPSFLKRYVVNLVLAYILAYGLHLLFHHHG